MMPLDSSAITVRWADKNDIEECLDFAMPRYAASFPHMTRDGLREWCRNLILDPNTVFLRTDHACGIAHFDECESVFEPMPIMTEIFVVAAEGAHPYEALSIYSEMKEIARRLGARAFDFGEATGVDLSSIATRVGGAKRQTVYRVAL